MAHIQLTNGTRLFANGNSGEESIWLAIGSTFTLQHVGWAKGAGEPVIRWPEKSGTIDVRNEKVVGDVHSFTVTAKTAGKTPIYGGVSGSRDVTAPLYIVSGQVHNHTDMSIDLLADVCKGSDPYRIYLLQRMLNNNSDNFFDQKAAHNWSDKHGWLTCGIVVKERGNQVFGKEPLTSLPQLEKAPNIPATVTPIRYEHPYHEPLARVSKRTDVKYKSSTIEAVRAKIVQFLRAGTPVRVGVLDNPVGMFVSGGKLIAYYAGGHTVLIVGCNAMANLFLYMDPLPNGSKLVYTGGVSDLVVRPKCNYLGMFEPKYEPARLVRGDTPGKSNILRQTVSSEGDFNTANGYFLEIVSGP